MINWLKKLFGQHQTESHQEPTVEGSPPRSPIDVCESYWDQFKPGVKSEPWGVTYDEYVNTVNTLHGKAGEVLDWALSRLDHWNYDARETAASLVGEAARKGALDDRVTEVINRLESLATRPWVEDTKETQANDVAIVALGDIDDSAAVDALCRVMMSDCWEGGDDCEWTAAEALSKRTGEPFMDQEDPVAAAREWVNKRNSG